MSQYRVGTHINLKQGEDIITRLSCKIAPWLIGFMALYGFAELALQANGI